MAELSSLAASTFLYGPFLPEQSIFKTSKESQLFLPTISTRKEILGLRSLQHVRSPELDDTSRCLGWMPESNQYIKLDSSISSPALVDVQEQPNSVLLSFGISGQCTRQQNILRFLISGSSETGREGIDFSLLADLVGSDACKVYMHLHKYPLQDRICLYEVVRDHYQHSLVSQKSELYSKAPLVDFVGDLVSSLKCRALPHGRVPFSGTIPEMKDLLSIIEEFYPSKNASELKNQSLLVPLFSRQEPSEAGSNIQGTSSKLQTVTVTPLKSPKKTKLNPPTKKRSSRKAGKERDMYRRSYLHACESLLSLFLEKRHGNKAILSLKKSDPELPQLLTQFSAGIAGTGLAVLFSIGYKVAGGRVPFCASKLLSTGFGFGLVWLSWAVNKLRDSIICISKNTSKVGVKDKEMIRRVDESMKEMFFGAATVMVFAMLKFA